VCCLGICTALCVSLNSRLNDPKQRELSSVLCCVFDEYYANDEENEERQAIEAEKEKKQLSVKKQAEQSGWLVVLDDKSQLDSDDSEYTFSDDENEAVLDVEKNQSKVVPKNNNIKKGTIESNDNDEASYEYSYEYSYSYEEISDDE